MPLRRTRAKQRNILDEAFDLAEQLGMQAAPGVPYREAGSEILKSAGLPTSTCSRGGRKMVIEIFTGEPPTGVICQTCAAKGVA
jgi:hypothetical protein